MNVRRKDISLKCVARKLCQHQYHQLNLKASIQHLNWLITKFHQKVKVKTTTSNFFRISSPLQSALFPVKIGTQEFNLLIDSGSTINILDEKHFSKLRPSPVLKPSKTRIYPYQSKKPLKVIDTFKASLSANDKSSISKIYVVKGKAGALIGKETSESLDLLRVGPPTKKSEPLNSVTVNKSNIDLVTINRQMYFQVLEN